MGKKFRRLVKAAWLEPLLTMPTERIEWKWVTLGQYIDEQKRNEALRQKQRTHGPSQLKWSDIRFDVSSGGVYLNVWRLKALTWLVEPR